MSLKDLISPPPPPPGTKLRQSYEVRLRRLVGLQNDYENATTNIRKQVDQQPVSAIRVRSSFVFRPSTAGPVVSSDDRTLPSDAERPPCTRLFSPRGVALRLELIALLQAHVVALGRAGGRPQLVRKMSLSPDAPDVGWVDLIASGAEWSPNKARNVVGPRSKKRDLVKSALKALEKQELVAFSPGSKRNEKYDRFILLREVGTQSGRTNVEYTIPVDRDDFLSLPITFFTDGWVHVLTNAEIAFLLMLCHLRRGATDPTVHHQVSGNKRLFNYGIGRDAYSAHRVLSGLGLIDVEVDPAMYPNGKVTNYDAKTFVPPHGFALLVDGFNFDAFAKVESYLTRELGRP